MHELVPIVITAAVTSGAAFLFSRGVSAPLMALARARARRVRHLPVSGALLYANGVPLDEEQFRDAFASMQAELDELSPVAERNQWELQRQYAAINRFSMLAGTYPHAFPVRSNAGEAWDWYQENGPYAVSDEPQSHRLIFERPGRILPPWLARRPRPEPPALD
jgi:hypothetical protein